MGLSFNTNGFQLFDAAGNLRFSSQWNSPHVVNYLSGTLTCPRISHAAGTGFNSQRIRVFEQNLGAVNSSAKVVGGMWRATDFEGVPFGSTIFLGSETAGGSNYFRYLQRVNIEANEWHSALGPALIDSFKITNLVGAGQQPPVRQTGMPPPSLGTPSLFGGPFHVIQFYVDNGSVIFRQTLNDVLSQYQVFIFPPSFSRLDFAAMTIEYKLWVLGFD